MFVSHEHNTYVFYQIFICKKKLSAENIYPVSQHTPVPLSVDSPAGTLSADSLLASIGLLQERGLLPVPQTAAEQLLSMLPVLERLVAVSRISSRLQWLPWLVSPFRQRKVFPLDIWSVLHISATSKDDKENSVCVL